MCDTQKIEPCPFCKGKMYLGRNSSRDVHLHCPLCGYCSQWTSTPDHAISVHNTVSRDVREADGLRNVVLADDRYFKLIQVGALKSLREPPTEHDKQARIAAWTECCDLRAALGDAAEGNPT